MTNVTKPDEYPKAFEQALNSGDLDQIDALYDDGATVRGSTGEINQGAAAVRDEMQKLIMAKAHITNTLRHVLRNGEVALIIVDYVLQIDTPDGQRTEMRGTATNVIKEEPGLGWRMIIANPQGTA